MAIAVAEALGGVVINADAMQVYADLPILTAQPTAAERARVPHRLFGARDAAEPSSVGQWLAEAGDALAEARAAGRPAIVVGGTGLYLKALTQGLAVIPAIPPDLRARLRAEAEGVPAEVLHARLASLDPAAATRLRPTDPQRILRALEVVVATGRSIVAFQAEQAAAILPAGAWRGVALVPDPTALKHAIDGRFDAMLAVGALPEAERLAARALSPALPAMRALGVAPLLRHLAGHATLAEAAAQAKRDTRSYARRQMTFARHQLAGFLAARPEEAGAALFTPAR